VVKALFATGGTFLILGCAARLESADGILRLIPALILLPLGRTFVAGPDLPPYLTQEGIVVAYFVPGALLALAGAVLWYRKS
jgi:hypothetical protein